MHRLGRKTAFTAALLGGASFLSLPAHANLLVNGDFETGTLSGWTASGNVVDVGLPYFGEGSFAADGNYYAVFNAGNVTPNGILSQTIATTIGDSYVLSFDYGSNGGQTQDITAQVSDPLNTVVASAFEVSDAPSLALAPYTLDFTADATSMTVSFIDYSGNPTNSTDGFLDNVSVDQAAPEPASLLLMGAGLAGLGVIRRRRKTA